MTVEEGLVEGMSDDRRRLDHDQTHCERAYQSPAIESPHAYCYGDGTCAVGGMLVTSPGDRMDDCFKSHQPANPAMEQIVGVEAYSEKVDQWVVAPGKDNQRNHVDHRQMTCATAKLGQGCSLLLRVVEPATVNAVADEIYYQDGSMQP